MSKKEEKKGYGNAFGDFMICSAKGKEVLEAMMNAPHFNPTKQDQADPKELYPTRMRDQLES